MRGAFGGGVLYRAAVDGTDNDAAIVAFAARTPIELLGNIGIGTWQWDPLAGTVMWDETTEQVYGIRAGAFDGTFESFIAHIHPEDRDEALAVIGQVAEQGGDYSIRHRAILPTGETRWLEGQGRILLGADGEPRAGFGIVYDITERYTQELERTQLVAKELASREELHFLIEAGDRLTGSLNTERVAERLADLIVPRIGRACIVDVRLDDPAGWMLTTVKADADSPPMVEVGSRHQLEAAATRLAQSASAPNVEAGDPSWLASDIPGLEALSLDGDNLAVVPLMSHGIRIGTVAAILEDDPARSTSPELLAGLCRRGAVALAHAELYADRSRFISMFQSRETRPAPSVPGLDIAVHYRPATDLVRLSGDLYDVFELPDGAWMVAVGDVCGKGVVAAGHAELCRSALRAAALSADDLVQTLAVLNRVLLAEDSRPMLTAALLRCEQTNDGAVVTVASAGHPPALLIDGGAWREVEASGTMLGVTPDPRFDIAEIPLRPGSAIALYSDGVTEGRFGHAFFGIERLGQTLVDASAGPAAGMAEDVGAAVDTWTSGEPLDDVLVAVVKAAHSQ